MYLRNQIADAGAKGVKILMGYKEVTHSSFDKSKIMQYRHLERKKSNLIIDLLSLGVYAAGPQVLTYRPHILRGVRI